MFVSRFSAKDFRTKFSDRTNERKKEVIDMQSSVKLRRKFVV